MFPAVSSVLAVGTLLGVFYTPVFVDSTSSPGLEAALDLVLLVTGLIFVLPLMVDALLPGWAGPGVRTLLAFADGLFDAIPGILVMTSGTIVARGFPGFAGRSGTDSLLDTHLGGGALLAVAESVGVPVIAVAFVQWARSDDEEARAIDAELDAGLDAEATSPGAARPATSSTGSPSVPVTDHAGLWWETDPRFAGRFHGRPE